MQEFDQDRGSDESENLVTGGLANLVGLVAAFVALVILVLIVLPVSFGDSDDHQTDTLQSLVHIAFFFVLTICISILLRSRKKATVSDGRLLWKSGTICLFLAAVTELLQIPSIRTASVFDFFADVAGIVFGSVWLASRRSAISWKGGWSLGLVGMALVFIAHLPMIAGGMDEAARRRAIPHLLLTDNGDCLWVGQGDAQLTVQSHGNQRVLAVDCPSGSYQGIRIDFGKAVDLSAYSEIKFEMINHGEPLELGVRIDRIDADDVEHRSYEALWLEPGDNDLALGLDGFRESGSSFKVVRVVVFGGEHAHAHRYSIRAIELQ